MTFEIPLLQKSADGNTDGFSPLYVHSSLQSCSKNKPRQKTLTALNREKRSREGSSSPKALRIQSTLKFHIHSDRTSKAVTRAFGVTHFTKKRKQKKNKQHFFSFKGYSQRLRFHFVKVNKLASVYPNNESIIAIFFHLSACRFYYTIIVEVTYMTVVM